MLPECFTFPANADGNESDILNCTIRLRQTERERERNLLDAIVEPRSRSNIRNASERRLDDDDGSIDGVATSRTRLADYNRRPVASAVSCVCVYHCATISGRNDVVDFTETRSPTPRRVLRSVAHSADCLCPNMTELNLRCLSLPALPTARHGSASAL